MASLQKKKKKPRRLPAVSMHHRTPKTAGASSYKKTKSLKNLHSKSATTTNRSQNAVHLHSSSTSRLLLTTTSCYKLPSISITSPSSIPTAANHSRYHHNHKPHTNASHNRIHKVLPEFDTDGLVTTGMVDEWLDSTQQQMLRSNVHSKFKSSINYCKLKFSEIHHLTYAKHKLHPSRVRVFASLLKLFIESITLLNPNYAFIKTILKDIYRSLFVHASLNEDDADPELSTFKDSQLYSEELVKLENLILDSNVDLTSIRKYIQQSRKQRTAKIVTDENGQRILTDLNIDTDSEPGPPDGYIHALSPNARKSLIFALRETFSPNSRKQFCGKPSPQKSSENVSVPGTKRKSVSFAVDVKNDKDSNKLQVPCSPLFAGSVRETKPAVVDIEDMALRNDCFYEWREYISERKRYRKQMVAKARAVRERRWFVKWLKHVKATRFEKTSNRLMLTRLELIKTQSLLEEKEKSYLHVIHRLKDQLNAFLTMDISTSSVFTPTSKQQKTFDKITKDWNRTIALHAIHLLEYKKQQFDEYLSSPTSIDPCSLRLHINEPLQQTCSRTEYYRHLAGLTTEQILLLWTNSAISNWIELHRESKKVQLLSHLIGEELLSNRFTVSNFSKDWSDGKIYVLLFHCIWPDKFSLSTLHDMPKQRLQTVCEFAKSMGFNAGPFITPHDILNECSDLNFAFLGNAFIKAPIPTPNAQNFSMERTYIQTKHERCNKLFRSAKLRESNRMKVFLKEILAAIVDIDKFLQDGMKGSDVWNTMIAKISMKVATVLAYRYRNKQPLHPTDPIETAILQRMCVLPRDKIDPYLSKTNPNEDYQALCKLMKTYAVDLRALFDLYANYAAGNTRLTVLSWLSFARNLRITDKAFNNVKLRQIFKNIVSPSPDVLQQMQANGQVFDHSEAMLDRELFSASVVLIAAEKCKNSQNDSLCEKVRIVLDKHLKFAKKSNEMVYQIAPFTRGGIESVFKKHGEDLKQIYYFYSRSDKDDKANNNKKSSSSAVNEKEDTAAEKTASLKLLESPLKMAQFRNMVKHAGLAEVAYSNQVTFLDSMVDQITRIVNDRIAPNATEIVYEEFLEMLAILCILRNPDPYTIMTEKLPEFLMNNVIKPICNTVMNKERK